MGADEPSASFSYIVLAFRLIMSLQMFLWLTEKAHCPLRHYSLHTKTVSSYEHSAGIYTYESSIRVSEIVDDKVPICLSRALHYRWNFCYTMESNRSTCNIQMVQEWSLNIYKHHDDLKTRGR